jgi:hypothetical protein
MPFCTIVEFEWDETFDREGLRAPSAARVRKRRSPMAA